MALTGLVIRREGPFTAELLYDPYLLHVVKFTCWQAFLSTLISILLAIPVARALHFCGHVRLKHGLLTLSLLAFVMPSLVVITGVVILLGNNGLLTAWVKVFAGNQWTIYGLNGILVAHVFLNLPFAVRVLSLSLSTIPATTWRLSAQMRLSSWQRIRHLEWPHCRSALLSATGLVFILCFNSFSIVLALGGGPAATTLEVAIYQSLKFDFNLNEALFLSWLQLLIVGSGLLLLNRVGKVAWLSKPLDTQACLPSTSRLGTAMACSLLAPYTLLLLAPLIALVGSLALAPFRLSSLLPLLQAAAHSALLASLAALLSLALGWLLLLPARHARQRGHATATSALEWLALHTLPMPAMVLSTGLFILMLPAGWLSALGLPTLVWLNALLVTPFVVTQLKPILYAYDDQYQRLLLNWRPSSLAATRLEWQSLKNLLPALLSLTGLLALGDVSVFAIFGEPEWITLPWLIYQYASSYRLQEASLASLLLLGFSAVLVYFIEGDRY
jgi:thiamine transport system permease protein